MTYHLQLCCLLALFVVSACQFGTGTKKATNQTTKMDTLTYEYKDYVLYSDHVVQTTETTDTSYFAASYPVFPDSTVNQFVLAALLGNDTTTIEGTAKTFISEFDEFFRSDPFPRVWTSETHAKVYRLTPTYLSLVIEASSYTGGAHGNYATIFKHYDLTNHQPITFDQVVSKQYQNELTAVAERYFRKQENLSPDQSLEEDYFFDDGRFSLPENFALERDSMLFLYTIYEIKPYVEGETKLRVPYSEIQRLLTDRAKRIVAELTM